MQCHKKVLLFWLFSKKPQIRRLSLYLQFNVQLPHYEAFCHNRIDVEKLASISNVGAWLNLTRWTASQSRFASRRRRTFKQKSVGRTRHAFECLNSRSIVVSCFRINWSSEIRHGKFQAWSTLKIIFHNCNLLLRTMYEVWLRLRL